MVFTDVVGLSEAKTAGFQVGHRVPVVAVLQGYEFFPHYRRDNAKVCCHLAASGRTKSREEAGTVNHGQYSANIQDDLG